MANTMCKRKCLQCGEWRLPNDFDLSKLGNTKRICTTCISRKEEGRHRNSMDWDWASALCKQVAMSAGFRRETYSAALTADTIRCLMTLQGNTCGITGCQFYLPPVGTFAWGTTPKQWLKSIKDPAEITRTPILVRVNIADGWVAGNIMIVLRGIYDLYIYAGGIHELNDLFKQLNTRDLVIFSKEQLHECNAVITQTSGGVKP